MKHGWEYKKLGDVCTIERGGSPRPITDYITDSEDGINWIKIGDAQEGSKYITSTKEKIRPEGIKKSRFVHKGDFILSNSMSFGRPYILKVDGCIHDGWLVIHDNNEVFIKDYLYYILASPIMYSKFSQLAVGGVVNNLNSSLVRKVTIPLPPKSTQLAIVSELDKINELIRLKKEQLKDFDKLAQSIFYEMFGDTVENEKGWEVKMLGDVCNITSSKRIFADEYTDKGIPFYRSKEVIERSKGLPISVELFISPERYSEIKEKFGIPNIGDILVTAVGTIGKIWSIDTDEKFYFKDGNLVWLKDIDSSLANTIFFRRLLEYLIDEYKKINANGAAYSALTIAKLKLMQCPLPPLPLQHLFAHRIEQIEHQKSEVQKAITDLETLLASRMQYWFE